MDPATVITLCKENIQPLRHGRNAAQLGTALRAQEDTDAQQLLQQEKAMYEEAITNYEGDDPLEKWYEYILWVEQSYPKSGHESPIAKLLHQCLLTFERESKYHQDRRFIRLWINYISTQKNPLELYQVLYNNGIGTMVADMYRAWAFEYELVENYQKADEVYSMGIRANAEPRDELDHAHNNFQRAVLTKVLGRTEERCEVALNEQRQAFSSLKAIKAGKKVSNMRVGAGRVRDTVPGVVPQIGSNENAVKSNATVQIYQDDEHGAEGKTYSILDHIPIESSVHKENTIKPGPWNSSAKKNPIMPPTVRTSFKVHEDSDDFTMERLRLFQNHVSFFDGSSYVEHASIPAFVPDAPNSALVQKVHYLKDIVYTNNRDMSMEEIKAQQYLERAKQCQMQNDQSTYLENAETSNYTSNLQNLDEQQYGMQEMAMNQQRQFEQQQQQQQFEAEQLELEKKRDEYERQQEDLKKQQEAEIERQRFEAETLERERVEAERQRFEAGKIERERAEAERQRYEAEKMERERLEAERQRYEADKMERERLEVERQRYEAEKRERERLEAERQRYEAETRERERLEAERQRMEADRLEKERLEAEKMKAEMNRQKQMQSNSYLYNHTPHTSMPEENLLGQSLTVNTKEAMSAMEDLWQSPEPTTTAAMPSQMMQAVPPQPKKLSFDIHMDSEITQHNILSKHHQGYMQSYGDQENHLYHHNQYAPQNQSHQGHSSSYNGMQENPYQYQQLQEQPRHHPPHQHQMTPHHHHSHPHHMSPQQSHPPQHHHISPQQHHHSPMHTPQQHMHIHHSPAAAMHSPHQHMQQQQVPQQHHYNVSPQMGHHMQQQQQQQHPQQHSQQHHSPHVYGHSGVMQNDLGYMPQQQQAPQYHPQMQQYSPHVPHHSQQQMQPPPHIQHQMPPTHHQHHQQSPHQPQHHGHMPPPPQQHSSHHEQFTPYVETPEKFKMPSELPYIKSPGMNMRDLKYLENAENKENAVSAGYNHHAVDQQNINKHPLDNVYEDENLGVTPLSNVNETCTTEMFNNPLTCSTPMTSQFRHMAYRTKEQDMYSHYQQEILPSAPSMPIHDAQQGRSLEIGSKLSAIAEVTREYVSSSSDSSIHARTPASQDLNSINTLASINHTYDNNNTRAQIQALQAQSPRTVQRNVDQLTTEIKDHCDLKKAISFSTSNETENYVTGKENYLPPPANSYQEPMEQVEEEEFQLPEGEINPFCKSLIAGLLRKIKFPQSQHSDGYVRMNSNLNKFVPSNTVMLGNDSYELDKCLGKGTYGTVYKAANKETGQTVALKTQKPAWVWEYYIAREIKNRLTNPYMLRGFMDISISYVANNGSVLVYEYSKYGNLLNVTNQVKVATGKPLSEIVAVFFTIEMLQIVEYLHKCKIIHGDIKPDNFLLMHLPTEDVRPTLQLIDFGCSIDMNLFPEDTKFHYVIKTEDFTCTEMQTGRPWTYQTDLYCLAASSHCLLFGNYMRVSNVKGKWTINSKFARYMKKAVWEQFFDDLLNIESCDQIPDLNKLRNLMEETLQQFSDMQLKLREVANVLKKR